MTGVSFYGAELWAAGLDYKKKKSLFVLFAHSSVDIFIYVLLFLSSQSKLLLIDISLLTF
jgi:hypothetical protein